MVRLSGMFVHEGKDGKFMRGNIGSGVVLLLKNKHKRGESDPDYILYIREKGESLDGVSPEVEDIF